MPTMLRCSLPTTHIASTLLALSICTQAWSQQPRWSLDPLRAPFPCHAVNIDGDNVVFLKPLVFVCNGNEILEMPAGSILGINLTCSGTTGILAHNFDERGGLFDILRRQCRRARSHT